MPSKGKVLVLKRMVVGDQDLLVKLYCYGGITNLLVRDGALPESPFFSVFEPFNLMLLTYRQWGQVIVPLDIQDLVRLSYYATDYERYLWMCQVAGVLLRWVRFYDEELLSLAVEYLKLKVKNPRTFHLRFYLDLLTKMGIYKEKLFSPKQLKMVNTLKGADLRLLERLSLSHEDYTEIRAKIEAHLEESL